MPLHQPSAGPPPLEIEGRIIAPQPGPQTAFLGSPADIAIYGGAAGGGKSWALLLEPLRHVHRPDFGAVFFRRTGVQIRNEGGLWDESAKLYPHLGARPREQALEWRFPGGASVSFGHLEHERSVFDWQGSQIPLIGFDELTHFSAQTFFYMLSRNRSMCGIRPYVRATCNPDADSWVAKLIEWWIDPETGLPIAERSGVLRWFVRAGESLVWADRPKDLAGHRDTGTGEAIPPKSLTFIGAGLDDNAASVGSRPSCLAPLSSSSWRAGCWAPPRAFSAGSRRTRPGWSRQRVSFSLGSSTSMPVTGERWTRATLPPDARTKPCCST
ncbi:MAG TPA: terminase family protein [Allosphingosinicella sp.]|jgi:hypothetical protein|nr:terminase family protein [Allosphingosinicella sp.]